MNINLDLYKVFYSVAKNESITRAANELMISQPAISRSIKMLEDSLNTKLFIRKRDGVELTEIGETIYNKVKDALDLLYSAENDITSLTNLEKGTLNIGASKTIVHEFLLDYIKDFHKQYPDINIRIFTERDTELLKKAKSGLIDVVFANMPFTLPEGFESIKVMNLHDVLVVNNEYSYLLNKDLTKEDLEKLPLLLLAKGTRTRSRLDDYCIDNNISLNPKMEFSSNSLIKDFTLRGFGVGMLTKEHAKEEIKEGKLFELNYKFNLKEKYLGMIYDSSRKNSLIAKSFIEHIKKQSSN